MSRRLAFAVTAMGTAQAAVYVARPMTSYRLLGLGAGARAVGLVTACFALIPLFAAIPLGRMADRTRGPLLVGGCLVQVVGCALLGLAPSPLGLAAASGVLGLGHLGLALGVQAVVARESSADRHDQHFGWLTAGVSLGQLVGPLVGGFIVGHRGHLSLAAASARALFVAAALATAAAAFAAVAEHGAAREPLGADAERRGSVRAIVGTRGVPAAIFASVAVLSAADVFTAYLPVLGHERGIGASAVGILLAIRAAASLSCRVGIGTIVRLVGRVRLMALSTIAAAAALAAVASVHGVVPLALVCAVVGLGLGFGQPLSMTMIVQLVPERARATALAVRLTGNRLGQVAAPAAAAGVAGGAGAGSVFWLMGGLLLVSGAVVARAS